MSTIQTLKLLPKMLLIMKRAMLSGVMSRAKKLQSSWQEHDPQEPHWHLGPIGVLPEMQRKGIGSKMLKRACEIIDQKLDAAYLETDRSENLTLYERFGFSTIAEADILGVHNWFMWRSARGTIVSDS